MPYGYRVDYRRISLAQVAATDVPTRDRVAPGGVEQVRTPHGTFIAVELVDWQHPYVGTHPLHENDVDAAARRLPRSTPCSRPPRTASSAACSAPQSACAPWSRYVWRITPRSM